MPNALDALKFESPFYDLGGDYHDEVSAGDFKSLRLLWRSDALFEELGIDNAQLTDAEIRDAFGDFTPLKGALHPPLAQRYIGYQFRQFNPHLGDGRGFLWGQMRGRSGKLWDLGTKGSGTTPYSRGGDGRLTLKGGVREIIAAEFLHAMGCKTSRPLVVLEHRQELWRGDEPSPTRASILVRMGESHIRFGTFERIFYLERDEALRKARMEKLADHVVEVYYPHLSNLEGEERYLALFEAVVRRTAEVVAHWIKAGFCHGVLNTDNMSITGDSFDYGPFAFMEAYTPDFTAAYFDHQGLYAFERQPDAVAWNLAMLLKPFSVLAPEARLIPIFDRFGSHYLVAIRKALLPRMGFEDRGTPASNALIRDTFELLRAQKSRYHDLFRALRDRVKCKGLEADGPHLPLGLWSNAQDPLIEKWQAAWRACLSEAEDDREALEARLAAHNPDHIPYRHEIERVWSAIDRVNNWQPFYTWMDELRDQFKPQSEG